MSERMLALFCVTIIASLSGCEQPSRNVLCPDLTEIGKGSKRLEEARRCVRVMAARYSDAGETPNDTATAALDFCYARKIEPIFSDEEDVVLKQRLLDNIEADLRKKAIRTVVEMRTGKCNKEPHLFDGTNDPIDRP